MSQFNDNYPNPHNQQKNTDLSASTSIEAVINVTHNNGQAQEIPMPTCDIDDERCGVCQ